MIKPQHVKFPPDCEMVVRAIWDYLDDNATADQLAEIEDHLAGCEYCRAHTEFERDLVRHIGNLRKQHADPERLRSRVLDAIRGVGGAGETP